MKKIDWDFYDEEEFIDETYLKDVIYVNGSILGNYNYYVNEYGNVDYNYYGYNINNNVISTIDYTNNWDTANWNNINYGNE
jgi:hypothetical protein